MHILESFALYSGLKIDRPEINEKFFPCQYDKFILISDFSYTRQNRFQNFSDVIVQINDDLKQKNIGILYITNTNQQIDVDNTSIVKYEQFKPQQLYYLIKNCELFCGTDELCAAIASSLNVKNIFVGTPSEMSFSGPFFNQKGESHVLANSVKNIKVEDVCSQILTQLDAKNKAKAPKTLHIGSLYRDSQPKIIEMIPDGVFSPDLFSDQIINIRLDYLDVIEKHHQINMFEMLKTRKCNIITDKKFEIQAFFPLRQNINSIAYDITKNIDVEFLKQCRFTCQNTNLIFNNVQDDSSEVLKQRKLETIDIPIIISVFDKLKFDKSIFSKNDIRDLKYRSKKFILAKGKAYISQAAFKSDRPVKTEVEMSHAEQPLKDIEDNLQIFEEEDSDCVIILK